MSRRKTSAAREARQAANKKKRAAKVKQTDPRIILRQKASQAAALRKVKEIASVYREIMLEISNEYHGGNVQYCMFRPKTKEAAKLVKEQIAFSTSRFASIHKDEQTPELMCEVGSVVKDLYDGWIHTGIVVPDSVHVNELPNGRIYTDGRIEAINRGKDEDVLEIKKRLKERLIIAGLKS